MRENRRFWFDRFRYRLSRSCSVLVCDVTGGLECEVTSASENELQCVLQSEGKTHIVTNQGSHSSRFTPFHSFCRCQIKSEFTQTQYSRKRVTFPKADSNDRAVACGRSVTASRLVSETVTLFFCKLPKFVRINDMLTACCLTSDNEMFRRASSCLSNLLSVAAYGQGYAWNPASLTVSVGDAVTWRWEAPAFQKDAYRVWSVSSPSATTYDGGPLYSGDTKTAEGRI